MQRRVKTTSFQVHCEREQRGAAGGGHYTMFAWSWEQINRGNRIQEREGTGSRITIIYEREGSRFQVQFGLGRDNSPVILKV